jgi:hypothetical protein
MGALLYTLECTIPAGTPVADPAVFDLPVDNRQVAKIIVRVPPGPHGEVGFQIWYGSGLAFPYTQASWVVADNTSIEIQPDVEMTSGNWQFKAYNTGDYSHSLYVEMYATYETPTLTPALSSQAVAIRPV